MKILSEILNKTFDTVQECEKAEKLYLDAKKAREEAAIKAQAEKAAKEKQLQAQRATRAKEVEDAYKAIIDARKIYDEKLTAFVKDYGSFHMTVRTGENNPFNFFDSFFNDSFPTFRG